MTSPAPRSFADLWLSQEMLASLQAKGFESPSPIQAQVIPLLMKGTQDMIGQAATGTGKTAAFGIPLIEKILPCGQPQALILTPTRELAIQVTEEIHSFQSHKKQKLRLLPIYWGQSYDLQIRALKKGVDLIVGTPGRIIDHLQRKTLKLDNLAFLILDEADEMLNMGFIDDINKIFQESNEGKQVLLFSATMPQEILQVAERYMQDYQLIAVKNKQLTTTNTTQWYFEVRESDKFEALCRIIDIESDFYGIVFCKTKVDCDVLTQRLHERGYQALGLHGDVQQKQRERILKSFKEKKSPLLVATDVAARGIDVNDISHVINYALPQDTESYVHRVGRTGRAGKSGKALTFVTPQEYKRMLFIQKMTKTAIQKGNIPAVSEILEARKLKLKADIDAVLAGKAYQQYDEVTRYLLQDHSATEVISALLKLNYQEGLSPDGFKEIQACSIDATGTSRLFIALGKKDGFSPRSLVNYLQEEADISPRVIDEVRVMEDFSFVTVPFAEAEVLLHLFAKKTRAGRKLITKAKAKKADAPRRNEKGNQRSFSPSQKSPRKTHTKLRASRR